MATQSSPSDTSARLPQSAKQDEESQANIAIEATCDQPPSSEDLRLEDNSDVPKLSYPKLFWFFFYNFGLFAWGGPVAQIALIKERLVLQDKWISLPRFQRVFSVYQVLPGPEAAELCMFFGCLSAGRIGGIIAGIAFILPGFVLMLLASYLYSLAGFENRYFNASFRALQPVVAAMILRATHKLADHSLRKHGTKDIDPFLLLIAVCTAINGALRINIFISLGLYGVIYSLISRRLWVPAGALFILQYVGYGLYVAFRGVPSAVSLALGIARTPSLVNLFVLGLVAGSLSFGGAYAAIPFVQVEAVLMGSWLPQNVFIDGIAIANILPAPLVIFATFVGFQGAYSNGDIGNAFAGAVIITLGMFFPCFLFTIAGHELLEKLVRFKVSALQSHPATTNTSFSGPQLLASFFDGLCGSVIGIIAIMAAEVLKASVEGALDKIENRPIEEAMSAVAQVGPAAVLYMLALTALYRFRSKYAALLLVAIGAIAGQFLFIDSSTGTM